MKIQIQKLMKLIIKYCKQFYYLRKVNDKATVIKSDMNFGSYSYFIKFLSQCWVQNQAYFNADNFKNVYFNPM